MSYFESTITAPALTPGNPHTARCILPPEDVARIIARHYGWVLTDLGRVRRPATGGGDLLAESIGELTDAAEALRWISSTGYPAWLDLPSQTHAVDQLRRHLLAR